MEIFCSIISVILAFFNVVFINLGIKKIEVNEISADNSVVVDDLSESNLLASAEYAANARNRVQCVYTDSKRGSFRMTNEDMTLTHKIKGTSKTATLTDADGNVYISDSFRSFCSITPGAKIYFENSVGDTHMNTIRLGEYYYDCHIRDLKANGFYVDKEYHVYSDRLYMQYTAITEKPTTKLYDFGSEITVPYSSVASVCIKDKNGFHKDNRDIDEQSVEFVAFDIKNTGVVGFIIPSDGSTQKVTVTKGLTGYTVTQYAAYEPHTGINDNNEEGGYDLNSVTFGCRIYTDKTHSFDGVTETAFEERHPLDSITIEDSNANAEYLGYDALRGTYTIKMDGTHFQYAYDNPDCQFKTNVRVKGNGTDSVLYFRAYTVSGGLEAATLLDSENNASPIDVQVCKNFQGDGGEPVYSPVDHSYGDAFFPVKVRGNEMLDFTVIHLYQNWGNYPIKQLSSIEFHTPYYHISTGTTESNCLAPYFVSNKDGWLLPDFRTRSGIMWSGQPQFNSVGILKFMVHKDEYFDDVTHFSEYMGTKIDSCGLAYCDFTNEYKDDCGKYTYSLRHVEMPQTDENRTYYSLRVTFNEDVTYKDFKNDFDLFSIDTRCVDLTKISYLNKNNVALIENRAADSTPVCHTLGTQAPYFALFCATDEESLQNIDAGFGCNFALLIKNSKIISCGEELSVPFVFRELIDGTNLAALTLDVKELSFKKGDTIDIDMILLPWGIGTETEVSRVMHVRQDSVLYPVTVSAAKGTVEDDAYLPVVKAENNEAEFTVKGGRNNISVTVKDFSSVKRPVVSRLVNGEWEEYELASSNGYDGITVRLQPDGKYSFSFVYDAADPFTEYSFKVVQ